MWVGLEAAISSCEERGIMRERRVILFAVSNGGAEPLVVAVEVSSERDEVALEAACQSIARANHVDLVVPGIDIGIRTGPVSLVTEYELAEWLRELKKNPRTA